MFQLSQFQLCPCDFSLSASQIFSFFERVGTSRCELSMVGTSRCDVRAAYQRRNMTQRPALHLFVCALSHVSWAMPSVFDFSVSEFQFLRILGCFSFLENAPP